MRKREKLWLILALGVSTLAIILLSSGISSNQFQPGRFTAPSFEGMVGRTPRSRDLFLQRLVIEDSTIFLIAAVPLLLSFAYLLFTPNGRKDILKAFIRGTILALASYIMVVRLREILDRQRMGAAARGGAGLEESVEFIALTPAWLTFGVSLLFTGGLLAAIWILWRKFFQPVPTIELVALEARQALQDLQSGLEFNDIILRCYAEMCLILNRERGIRRAEAMTPREFEQRLALYGYPAAPVRELTRLFEKVRYGGKQPEPQERDQALNCLSAIAQAGRQR